MKIRISLNGEWCEIEAVSIGEALHKWGYAEGQIAVAINGEFVARGAYAEHMLCAQDCVDVVAPIQGG